MSPQAGPTLTLFDLFQAGGVIGYVITALAFATFFLVLDLLWILRRDHVIPADLLGRVEVDLAAGRPREALRACDETPCLVATLIAAALPRAKSEGEAREAIAEAGELEATKLLQRAAVLNLIAGVAPMLGLLGTVQGMIIAFNTIGYGGGMATAGRLAPAIALALVTTFQGLVVAIPSTAAYFFFKNRIVRAVLEAGAVAEEVLAKAEKVA